MNSLADRSKLIAVNVANAPEFSPDAASVVARNLVGLTGIIETRPGMVSPESKEEILDLGNRVGHYLYRGDSAAMVAAAQRDPNVDPRADYDLSVAQHNLAKFQEGLGTHDPSVVPSTAGAIAEVRGITVEYGEVFGLAYDSIAGRQKGSATVDALPHALQAGFEANLLAAEQLIAK